MSEHNETVTIKKDALWKGAVAILAILLVISLLTGGFGINKSSSSGTTGKAIVDNGNAAADNNANAGGNDLPADIKVSITDKDPVLGNVKAAVSIVEFSDFECPFCSRAYFGPVSDFKSSNYFKNGDVNFVFKQFPLTQIHPYSQKAAEAAVCALQQGNDKFWKLHDLLFANQDKLSNLLSSSGLDAVTASIKTYADSAGLNTATFNKCLDNGEGSAKVLSDSQEALSAGGQGTPYFVVVNNENGKTAVVSGAVPYASTNPAGLDVAIKSVI